MSNSVVPVIGRLAHLLLLHKHGRDSRHRCLELDYYIPIKCFVTTNLKLCLNSSFPNGSRSRHFRKSEAERADRVPDAAWEEHRETITELYTKIKMKLEDLITYMEEKHGFRASEQQYKIQFNKWGLRKNKRRIGQRESSPESGKETPARPHPNFRSLESTPVYNIQSVDLNGFMGATGTPSLGVYTNPMGGMQAFLQDPFSQPATNLNNVLMSPYTGPYPANYVQPPQPTMYGQFQQFNAVPGAQTAQAHFQVNNYSFIGAGGGASQLPGRQMSRGITAAAERSRHPIHQSVQSGSLRGTKLLADANPDCVHALDGEGIGPAWLAAQGGFADILRLLVRHKVDLNIPHQESRRYPIHQAAQGAHKRVVELLLENGADPDPVDQDGVTPLWLSAQEGNYEIVSMILNRSSAENRVNIEVEWEKNERRAIHQAAQGGHLKTVQLLLEKGATCDPVDAHGTTPLWSAAQNGNADLVRELLKAGAKVDVTPYEHNIQPIHQAARNGHIEVVRVLLEFGASLTPEADTFDDSEPSPFLLACLSDKPDLINIFLEHDVDLNMTSKNQKGALHFAAHGGCVATGRLLIDSGCNVDARTGDGWTPLMLAAQDGHLNFVDLLIESHANIDAEETDGATSLWMAAQQGHTAIVKRLLEAGAKQLPTRESSRRPIHQAAQNGHLACVKLLLKHSPGEIDESEGDGGFTALTLASQKNETAHLSVMRFLVSQGAKVM